jgi:4-hydroxy-tetrahydrodipicolinate synthase
MPENRASFSRAQMKQRLRGVYTAIITPFKDGAVDEKCLRDLVEIQVAGGVDGLVPAGTTGESPTLSHEENVRVIRICVETAKGRIPILAGTGSNSTSEALDLSRRARESGADGLLVVAPYYNRPTQRGLMLHFEAIMREVDLPLVLYNIPGRTGVNVEPETVAALKKSGGLAGVKEASGLADQVSKIVELCGPDFSVFSGDDSLTLPFMSVGALGVISVVSNVAPRETGDMVRAFMGGRTADALVLHQKLFPLVKALFVETNPVPVKTALAMLGKCRNELRLPLAPMEEGNAARLRSALGTFGFKV